MGWRPLEDKDKEAKKLVALSPHMKGEFYIKYNKEWGCYCLYDKPHILVSVSVVREVC